MGLKPLWIARPWLVMSAVAATAAIVRVTNVYGRPFWEDEVASARIVVEPTFLSMLHRVAQTESTPPLWYAIAWLVHQMGVPLQSERLLSVLFGAALAAAAVGLARRFVALPLATVAGLTTALGTEFVLHGAELRAYELFALLSAVLGLSVLGMLEHGSRRWDVALAATVAAGCLTHYFFAFSVAALLGWLWLDSGARHIRRRGTLAVFAGGIPAAAWIPVMLAQYQQGRFNWIGSFRWRSVVAVPLRLFTYAYTGVPSGPTISVLAIIVFAVGGITLAHRSAAGRLMVVLAAGPLVAAAGVWAAGAQVFDLRNLIGIGVFLAVLGVSALETLPRRVASIASVAVAGALIVSVTTSTAERIPAYDAMARSLVRSGWGVSMPIMVFGDPYRYRLPFEWYLPRQPTLQMARVLDSACAEVFVVTPSGKIRRERLRAPHSADRVLHGVTLLVDPAHRPSCVRSDDLPHAGVAA